MTAIYWLMNLGPRIKSALGLARLAALVPGLGSLSGGFMAVMGFVCSLIGYVFEGVSLCIAHPVVFTVVAAAFFGGAWSGIDWDKHKVEVANAKLTSLQRTWQSTQAEQEQRLADAMAARKAAEETAKASAARALTAEATAARMRKLTLKGATAQSNVSLPLFSNLFGSASPTATKK